MKFQLHSRWLACVSAGTVSVVMSVASFNADAIGEEVRTPATAIHSARERGGRAQSKVIHIRLNNGGLQSSEDAITWTNRELSLQTFVRDVTFARGHFVAVGGSYFHVPAVVLTSCDGVIWKQRRIPTKSNLYGVTFGNDLFVTVGEAGTILTSVDGVRWTQRPAPCDDVLLATVTFAKGRFVAGGESGCILTSTNGLDWTRANIAVSLYIGRIDFVGDCFWVRDRSQVFSSPDGIRWERSNELSGARDAAQTWPGPETD